MLLWLLFASGVALGQLPMDPMEGTYADFNDAFGAVSLIDSNPDGFPDRTYGGKSRDEWERIYTTNRSRLLHSLQLHSPPGMPATELRAIEVMREAVKDSPPTPHSLATVGHCSDARRTNLKIEPLQDALYACFTERANNLDFEGSRTTRVAAFDLLTHLREPERRRSLFLAFQPLWHSLTDGGKSSPYRRMIRLAAAEARKKGSPIDVAARTLGVSPADIESWLVRILETWSEVSGDGNVEPWDYRFQGGKADRELADVIPRNSLEQLNERYYKDLGLDLAAANVILDLNPRAGKAPLAYTDYVRRGRAANGQWQPTVVRISASYGSGGLGPLNEFMHESGHAAHMLALHTRPAFMDLGDPVFYEAFADVPSWSVYEPAWQRKYLGRDTTEHDSLRALYSGVILDVAWALFDLRMLREPGADPNTVWTDITQRYMHITPHPELAWWAVRVQLVQKPGYMVNYGLGAVITADIRQRIAEQLGPFEQGDARWFPWISEHLLASGEETPTAELLRTFLGRPVSPEALLQQLRRMKGS